MNCKHHTRGMTLLEVMVTMSVIGMLASLAMPLWTKATITAQENLCINNQRKLYEAVAMYELERGQTLHTVWFNGTLVRNLMIGNGYLTKQIYFECPSSRVADYNDYILTYNGTTLQGTMCLVKPSTHVAK